METKRIDLPRGWSAKIKERDWLTEREAREISRAMVDSMGIASKLTKAGFDDSDPNTYEVFSYLSEQEKHNLSAFQSVLVTQFVTELDMGGETLKPLSIDDAENLPQPIFNALAAACLDEWTPKADELTDPKVPTDGSRS